jgi:uncharacterized membrane protein YdjX (TVP38/TMEM64 family)
MTAGSYHGKDEGREGCRNPTRNASHPAGIEAPIVMSIDARSDGRGLVASRLVAAVVVVLLVAGAVLARHAGVDAQSLQRDLLGLGCLAVPLFIAAFTVGELLHLPGIAFVVGARVLFGPTRGLAIGYLGALVALTVSFALARGLVVATRATREPWRPKWAPLRRAFERLERSPIASIALLRLVFFLASPLTYALAATKVSFRDHVVGTALGIVPPVLFWSMLGTLIAQ